MSDNDSLLEEIHLAGGYENFLKREIDRIRSHMLALDSSSEIYVIYAQKADEFEALLNSYYDKKYTSRIRKYLNGFPKDIIVSASCDGYINLHLGVQGDNHYYTTFLANFVDEERAMVYLEGFKKALEL